MAEKELRDGRINMQIAQEMIETGRDLEDLGYRIISELTKKPENDIRERIRNELRDAALSIGGLRIDRNPLNKTYSFYLLAYEKPYEILSDDYVRSWAERGAGALYQKVEDSFERAAKTSESEDGPESSP